MRIANAKLQCKKIQYVNEFSQPKIVEEKVIGVKFKSYMIIFVDHLQNCCLKVCFFAHATLLRIEILLYFQFSFFLTFFLLTNQFLFHSKFLLIFFFILMQNKNKNSLNYFNFDWNNANFFLFFFLFPSKKVSLTMNTNTISMKVRGCYKVACVLCPVFIFVIVFYRSTLFFYLLIIVFTFPNSF